MFKKKKIAMHLNVFYFLVSVKFCHPYQIFHYLQVTLYHTVDEFLTMHAFSSMNIFLNFLVNKILCHISTLIVFQVKAADHLD